MLLFPCVAEANLLHPHHRWRAPLPRVLLSALTVGSQGGSVSCRLNLQLTVSFLFCILMLWGLGTLLLGGDCPSQG